MVSSVADYVETAKTLGQLAVELENTNKLAQMLPPLRTISVDGRKKKEGIIETINILHSKRKKLDKERSQLKEKAQELDKNDPVYLKKLQPGPEKLTYYKE